VFNNIGGDVGDAIGLKYIDNETGEYHRNRIERFFLVEFFQ
jgi:hypothetical protein